MTLAYAAVIPRATEPATVKVTTKATSKLPKFGLPSRRSSSKKRNGLSPISTAETTAKVAPRWLDRCASTLLALTLAAVYT